MTGKLSFTLKGSEAKELLFQLKMLCTKYDLNLSYTDNGKFFKKVYFITIEGNASKLESIHDTLKAWGDNNVR